VGFTGTEVISHSPQVEYFSSLPEFTVCIFDNRGSGLSSCPKPPYKTTMLAEDAVALLDHLEWEDVHIVGLSMGGMIAQELAYKLGNRVVSLCLQSTYSKFNGFPALDNFSITNPFKIV
jgi:pimeloyl-ACP methyl ester carboxylesterase